MSTWLIIAAVFVGVSGAIGALAFLFRGGDQEAMEDRLDALASNRASRLASDRGKKKSVLLQPLNPTKSALDMFFERFGGIQTLIDQADVNLTTPKFFAITGGVAMLGGMIPMLVGWPPFLIPALAGALALLPLFFLIFMRKRRMKAFAAQLPDAMELMSRALRAGHSLGAGFQLVSEEMKTPIASEFGRVFEEQNFGVPFDDALKALRDRVPNMDLRFFCTAVVLQRQTGGDLAEILDKIGALVRERFKIWGQIQALTGEGRLSGIVLLALPPGLFAAVYQLNPDYCMTLFTDPMGRKMLVGGIVMQLLGAVAIRKIINIKV